MSHRLNQIYQHLYPDNQSHSTMMMMKDNQSSNDQYLVMNTTSGNETGSKERVIYDGSNTDGIVVLYLNDGPVNALSDAMVKAIYANVEKAYKDDKCKAIVLASKLKGFFVAGADITEIRKRQNSQGNSDQFLDFLKNGNGIMNFIESDRKPIVCAIDGVALGGGLELAMSCNGRVCSETSTLGLPELNLGIIPGYGGTQRLPRLIGVQKALDMMLTSQPINGKIAKQLGLVDVLVDAKQSSVLETAIQVAKEMAQGKRAVRKTLQYSQVLLNENSLAIIGEYEKKISKDPIQSRLPHVKACINAVRDGVSFISNGLFGLDREMSEFSKIANQPISRGMVHYFLASKATTKLPSRLTNTKSAPLVVKRLAVIGGGTMGSNIVVSALENGMSVVLKEINDAALNAGLDRVKKVFQSKLDRKRMSQQQFDKIMSNLSGQITYDGFDKLDMVIEAVLEIVELKQKIFNDLEKYCSDKCILATNTSTIDLDRISEKMVNKEKNRVRVIGLHYFTPAHVMPLLEIVRTEHNTSEILTASLSFSKQIKKTPVVVLNSVGFAVNRIFWPYGIAAQYLVERGLSPYQIDRAINQSVMRVGFFTMADMSGLDVLTYASGSIGGAYKERARQSTLAQTMVDLKRLGEKTGVGFYKYDPNTGKKTEDAEGLEPILSKVRQLAGNPSKLNYSDKDIAEACLLNAVNEACRVIEEKVVFRVGDIDVASVMGMGFMHYFGGLMKWADELGAKYVYDRLNKFYEDSQGQIVSFKPCQFLTHCANNNLSFYSADATLMQ